MKPLDCSNNTRSAQGQLLHEWFNHLDPDLDQPVQQRQALVQSTVELSLQLLRQRHWALCRRIGQPNKANGFYPRCLDTTFGTIQGLRVPRLRHGSLSPLGFTRSQRRWKKGDRLILQGFLDGLPAGQAWRRQACPAAKPPASSIATWAGAVRQAGQPPGRPPPPGLGRLLALCTPR